MAINLGIVPYGSNPTITVIFYEGLVPLNPATAPVVKVTIPALPTSTHSTPPLTNTGPGVYTFTIDCEVSGIWTARVYAGPGSGQGSIDLVWVVEATSNP